MIDMQEGLQRGEKTRKEKIQSFIESSLGVFGEHMLFGSIVNAINSSLCLWFSC